jgi:hypothetical protein
MIFIDKELDENSVCAKIAHTSSDGKKYNTKFYRDFDFHTFNSSMTFFIRFKKFSASSRTDFDSSAGISREMEYSDSSLSS